MTAKIVQKQEEAIRAGIEWLSSPGPGAGLINYATGTGKTYIGSQIAKHMASQRYTGLWICDRISLTDQAVREILRHSPGLSIGVEQGQKRAGTLPIYDLIVTTCQSSSRRLNELGKIDYLIVDEAHTDYQNEQYAGIYAHYPNHRRLGLSATAYGPDGTTIVGKTWDKKIAEYSLFDAIEDGALCPVVVKIQPLDGIDLSRIDYTKEKLNNKDREDLEDQFLHEEMLHKIAACIITLPTPCLVFCPSTKISDALSTVLNRKDPENKTMHLDCYMDEHKSGTAIKDFRAGKIQRVCNYRLWTYGIDLPNCMSVVFCCDKSMVSYMQGLGRVTRWCCRRKVLTSGLECECGMNKSLAYVMDLADNHTKHIEQSMINSLCPDASDFMREKIGSAIKNDDGATPLHEIIQKIINDPLIRDAEIRIMESREIELANPLSELTERVKLIGFAIPRGNGKPAHDSQISRLQSAFFEKHETRKRVSSWIDSLNFNQAAAILAHLEKRSSANKADPLVLWRLSHISSEDGSPKLDRSVLSGLSKDRAQHHWERHRSWLAKKR